MPFLDGALNSEALPSLTSDLVKAGIPRLTACGTTGEGSQLNAFEQNSRLTTVP
jgi:dihydrodipicolinate synthase/N-acetylneuraminate lyase